MGGRFTILGPVGVSGEDEGRVVGGLAPRHRAVLAYLLLHARTVIGTDRLICAVWGLTPPGTARAQIHASMAAIRRVLRQAAADQVLVTRTAGYVIEPGPGRLDLDEFTGLVRAAHEQSAAGDPEAAAGRLRAALGLWQGDALVDVSAHYVPDARSRLEDRRLNAVERLAELELSMARPDDVIDMLAAEVAAHPLRERLCGQFMLALHHARRQADALSVARAFRERLAEEAGLDPSRSFLALERSILCDDPGLEPRSLLPVADRAVACCPPGSPRCEPDRSAPVHVRSTPGAG